MISIDITVWFQLINFIITLGILNYFIIKPIRAILVRRHDRMAALAGDTEGLTTEAALKLEGYEGRLLEARVQAAAQREQLKKVAQTEAQSQLEKTMHEAQTLRQKAEQVMLKESATASTALHGQVDGFAKTALGRLLG